jgi:hypothetical protein
MLEHPRGVWLGYDAANLGDLNGDGWPDLAIAITDHDADLTTLFIVHGVAGGYADAAS